MSQQLLAKDCFSVLLVKPIISLKHSTNEVCLVSPLTMSGWYITLHYITLHYITLPYITLHYITLHYITLHYITLHYITLH